MTPFHLRSDQELLRASDDPVEAFAVFYRRHLDGVLRFVASRGVPVEAAADVAAETFLAALRRRDGYQQGPGGARLWLIGIAANKLADGRRRHARETKRQRDLQSYADRLTAHDIEGYAGLSAGAAGGAAGLLASLPEAQRHAVRQRVIENRDYAAIAGELGLTESATRQHVSRGLARLRTQLGRNR